MPDDTKGMWHAQSIIPTLTVKDGVRAIDFYKKAFGAKEQMRMPGPGGKGIMHAALQIGNSIFFLNDEFPDMGSKSPETLGGAAGGYYVYVSDVDSVFAAAIEAGGKEEMAVDDMFWGDRMGSLTDPFGHHWQIATHKEDVSQEEMRRRGEEFFAQMEQCKESEVPASV